MGFGAGRRPVHREELLPERGVEVDHVTVCRWVLRSTPLLAQAARPCGLADEEPATRRLAVAFDELALAI